MSAMEHYLSQQNNLLKIDSSNIFVTSKHTAAGTTLLTQAPLASVPFPSERSDRCNYCLRKGNLQCCSKCHAAYFCSQDCFLNSWIHFHRGLCGLPDYDKDAVLDVNQWLLDRAALTLASHDTLPTTTTKVSAQVQAFHQLEVAKAATAVDQSMVQKAVDTFASYTLPEMTALWQRVQISSFPITDSEMQLDPIAVGIYPITSQYVRHSCRPNAGVIYEQGHQLIIALEDIPPNTPITISYIDLIATRSQRQEALKARFGFEFQCDCTRCQGEYAGLDVLLERETAIADEEMERALVEQLRAWNVLEMVKEYGNKDVALPLESLDLPHLAHFICRMIAPDIYVPAFSNVKKSTAAMYYDKLSPLTQVGYTRKEDARRILPAINALLEIPPSPFLTIRAIKAAEKVLSRCIAESSWVEASRCTIYLYMVYRLVYPPLYPKMVYHSMLMSRASWNSLVQLELAGIGKKLERVYETGVSLWIQVAKAAVSLTFGRNSSLWREVVEIQWLFERDQKLK
ncbi:hypothetical protein V8B55DRAFT_1368535 [Mucor lusitanicus]|uniref:MYND-type domain-containing protein n=1 Tax=Mucor lusitanicus CBS 277.49 TaxID=747725 RepID=A0A168NRF9_MUCCL|nr:hypothetical protein MUCCIDRAFT_107212 [Mucor lusitanicus CBS 277.49]